MRRLVQWSATWTFLAMLAWMGSPSFGAVFRDADSPADTSTTSALKSSSAEEPQASMEQGLEQERQHNWAAAIETYRKAVDAGRAGPSTVAGSGSASFTSSSSGVIRI